MIARLAWAGLVVVALVVILKGLWAMVYIEPTGEALAEEQTGEMLVLVA